MANKVVVTGRVTSEPFLQEQATKNWLLKFHVEEQHKWTKRETQAPRAKSIIHKVVVWGPLAQSTAQEISKGDFVCVDGMLEYHEFSDPKRNGEPTQVAQINARQVELLHREG